MKKQNSKENKIQSKNTKHKPNDGELDTGYWQTNKTLDDQSFLHFFLH